MSYRRSPCQALTTTGFPAGPVTPVQSQPGGAAARGPSRDSTRATAWATWAVAAPVRPATSPPPARWPSRDAPRRAPAGRPDGGTDQITDTTRSLPVRPARRQGRRSRSRRFSYFCAMPDGRRGLRAGWPCLARRTGPPRRDLGLSHRAAISTQSCWPGPKLFCITSSSAVTCVPPSRDRGGRRKDVEGVQGGSSTCRHAPRSPGGRNARTR